MIRRLLWLSALLTTISAAIYLQAIPRQHEDCWGTDHPCSDGKYRDRYGKIQPASCDNFDATGKAQVHDCKCGRAMQSKDDCDKGTEAIPGDKCAVYCRESACKCKSMECS